MEFNMKQYLVASPNPYQKLKIYKLNEKGDFYGRIDVDENSGWSLDTIAKYPRYGWLYFDTLEECQTYLAELEWNKTNFYRANMILNGENGNCRCAKCGRSYNIHQPSATDYYGDPIQLFVEDEVIQVKCFCGEQLKVRFTMTVVSEQI